MTMAKVVRTSKFRHVFGTGSKKEACYDGVNVSLDSNDWHLVKANTQYLSIHWDSAGGGAFLVHPHTSIGRLSTSPPLYTGHCGPVLDTDFHPCDENLIASAGEDGRILLWNIPKEGPHEPCSNYCLEFMGHERRIVDLQWNPSVDSLLASASHDMTVRLWDVKSAEAKLTLSGHTDAVLDQCWSLVGDRLVTSCRDKSIRIFDPRTGSSPVGQRAIAHSGVKGIRVLWLGASETILTTGFGRASEREISLWDVRKLEEAMTTLTVDTASGPLLPFYDADCKMLYLAGRGDGNIRYYELISEAPYLYALSEYKSTDPQRGLALLPKRAVATNEMEIARFVKVYGSQPILEPISFKVPRREGAGAVFASDIYPETVAPEPALSVEEYFGGVRKAPRRISLETTFIPLTPAREIIPSETLALVKSITVSDAACSASNRGEASEMNEDQLRDALRQTRKENDLLRGEINQKNVRIRQLEALINNGISK